jgi:predicted small secreted protein
MKRTILWLAASALLAAACGAGQKIESGATQVDNSLDRTSKKAEKEVNSVFEEDAGKKADSAK